MTVLAVSVMRNEGDVAPWVVRHMLDECDRVIVADNGSTDGTREALTEIAEADPRLTLVDEPGPYRQAEIVNRLASMEPATWVVPFDADEWWMAYGGRIGTVLDGLHASYDVARAGQWVMVPQPTDWAWPNPFERIVSFRPGELSSGWTKVAYRPRRGREVSAGGHGVSDGSREALHVLGIRHIPFRSYGQAVRKLRGGRAQLEAAGEPPEIGTHWRTMGAWSDEQLEAWWSAYVRRDGLERLP